MYDILETKEGLQKAAICRGNSGEQTQRRTEASVKGGQETLLYEERYT